MKMRAFVKSESGQVMILTVLCTTVLIGFMALAIDVGLLFRAKRNLQMVADAAATAGALHYSYGFDATTAATNAASENGVTAGGGTTVDVNMPPHYGAHTGPGFVEVILKQPNPTFFMGLISHSSFATISARAVAGPVGADACIWLMNDTGTDLKLQGAATIESSKGGYTCGIYSNSTSSDSVSVKGQGNTILSNFVGTRGGLSAGGNSNTVPTPTTTGITQQAPPSNLTDVPLIDPYAATNPPTCVAPSGTTGITKSKITYYPLLSSDGPGCYKGNVYIGSNSSLSLTPGMYIFKDGNVYIGNNVTAPGVTFEIWSGALTVASTSAAILQSPMTGNTFDNGAYNGTLLLAPSSNTSDWNIQWGSADGQFLGIINAPGVNLTLQDQGGSPLVTGLYVGSLDLGAGSLTIDNISDVYPNASPLKSIALVE